MDDIKKFKKEINNTRLEVNLRESASGSRQPAIVEWQAPAFRYYLKDVSWYWLSFIIAILLTAFAVWQKNFLFAIFILLAEISVLILARRQPELIKFKVDDKGIAIAGKVYLFSDLENFCFRSDDEDKNFEELILKRKTHFNPYLKIFVDAGVSSAVRGIISQKLTEEAYEDSLLESIFKWLRF